LKELGFKKYTVKDISTCLIIFVLLLASYINILKPLTGIKIWPIIVDIFLFLMISTYLLVIKIILKNQSYYTFKKIEIIVFLFLIISLLQIFNINVPELRAGLEGFRKTAYQMLGVLLGIYFIYDEEQIEKIIKYTYLLLIPLLLYGIKQFFYFSSFDYKIIDLNLASQYTMNIFGRHRAISIFSGPFHFGMFSCLMSLMSLHFFLRKGKIIYLIFFYISIFGVFFSGTRVNAIALIITIIFYFWISKPRKQIITRKLLVILTIAFVTVIIILFNFSFVVSIFNSILNVTDDTRFLNRFSGYKKIFEAFLKKPIIGYGMGSAGDTLERNYNWEFYVTSHNMFLKILIETGLFGIIIYIIFFFMWFKRAYNLLKYKNNWIRNFSALVVSIVVVLIINGLTSSAVEAYPINLYIWFFMGMLIKVWILNNERAKVQDENRYGHFSNA